MSDGVVDELIVAVRYAYDRASANVVTAEFKGMLALGASVTAALVGITIASADAADAAHDNAAAIGLTTEAYTALAYAAERSGATTDNLRIGMMTLNRQLQAARGGSVEVAKVFASLKVRPEDFATGSDALGDVMNGLRGIKDEGDRARIKLLLFGEASGRLGEFLDRDADSLLALTDRARDLGAVITDDAADGAGRLMDSLGDLQIIAAGLTRQIGLGLAPRLADLTDGMVDWFLANRDLIGQQIDRTISGVGHALDALQTPAGKAVAVAGSLALAWGGVGVARSMYDAAAAANPLVGALGGQAGKAATAAKAGGILALQLAVLGLAIDDVRVTAEGGDSVLLALGRRMGVEGEVQVGAKELVGLFGDMTDLAYALGPAIKEGIGSGLDYLAENLPFVTDLVHQLADAIRGLDIGGVLTFASDRLADARTFTQLGTRALKGESTDIDRAAFSRFEDENPIGNLARAIREAGSATQGQRILSLAGLAPPVSVTVNAGPSRDEMARMAGEAAREEVEREALRILGMME